MQFMPPRFPGQPQAKLARALWISIKTIITTIGLKSRPPKLGSNRLMGASTGSVTWFTNRSVNTSHEGYGGFAKYATKDSIILAKIASVNSQIAVLIILAMNCKTVLPNGPSPYPCPSWTDFR